MERGTILIIVDPLQDPSLLKRLFRIQGARILTIASDHQDLLSFVASHTLTLVVIDLRMEFRTGLATVKKIRSSPNLRHIPILCIAADDQEYPFKGSEGEETDYLFFPRQKKMIHSKVALLMTSAERQRHLEQTKTELSRTKARLKKLIREKQQAEEALRESSQQLRSFCTNLPDIIYTLDFKGEFTFVNPAWEKLLGYTADEVIGRYFVDFGQEEDIPKYRRIFKQIRDERKILNDIHGILIHKSGSPRLFNFSGAPNMDTDGNVTGMVGFLKDITEQEKLQAQLLHAQKMEAIGILAGGVAHDFNNLLQAISGYADLLLLDLDENKSGYSELQEIRQTAKRGAELTRHLLTFSRKLESKLRPISLNHEIKKVRNLLERTIPKMIRIDLRLMPDPAIINADPVQIEQVLMNLGVNARDAMPDGGTFIIKTDKMMLDKDFCKTHLQMTPGEYFCITVTDTGIGMDSQTLEHIYEPFFTTKKARKGTGLGLSIVYGIVKNHGGYILCESRPAKGTTFKIFFPVLNQEAVSALPMTEISEKDISLQGTETVMLVDDDIKVRHVGGKILKKFGYRMLTASSGEAALKSFRRKHRQIDLVLLDVNMPGMGGKRCLEEMLKIKPDAKIIITTGYPVSEQFKKEIAGRIAGFIDKPYVSEALLRKTREVLTRP